MIGALILAGWIVAMVAIWIPAFNPDWRERFKSRPDPADEFDWNYIIAHTQGRENGNRSR